MMLDINATDKENFFDFWRTVFLPEFPKAKIKYKNESGLMRFISPIVCLYSSGFMSHVTTVIGNTIYFPSASYLDANYQGALRTLCHEFVHFYDRRENKLLFEIKYLFPQILSLLGFLSILSFVHVSFLMFLVFFVFLVPGIPAPYRTQFELAGYAMTLYLRYRGAVVNPVITQDASEIAGIFTGPWYFWMARDRQLVATMLLDRYERFPDTHPAFIKVREWLKT